MGCGYASVACIVDGFIWPREGEVVHTLDWEQWNWLISGVDWMRANPRPDPHWKV